MSKTLGFKLSPVDVDSLPSLSVLLDGELLLAFERELRAVVSNILDPQTDAGAKRLITLVVSFHPEADAQSALYKLKKMTSTLSGAVLPQPARMVFRKDKDSLAVALRSGVREGFPDEVSGDLHLAGEIPPLDQLFGGLLDAAWRRELISVLLNIDDPRTETAVERSITIKLAFSGDADRSVIRYKLERIQSKLSPCKTPDASTLFLEFDRPGEVSLSSSPGPFLPDGKGGIARGRQSEIN